MLHYAEEKLRETVFRGVRNTKPSEKRGVLICICVALEPLGLVKKDFKEKTGNSKLELIFDPMGLPR